MISGINSNNNLLEQLNMTSAKPKPEEMFAKIDLNGDGSIDKTEIQSFSERISNQDGDTIDISKMFAEIDTDSDGLISQDEFLAAKPPKPQGMGPGRPPDPEEMFNNMDVNGDGSIDKDEMKAFMEKMPARGGNAPDVDRIFSETDTDGDGMITKEEFVSAETKRQQQMQAQRQTMMNQSQSVSDDDTTSYLLKSLNDSDNLLLNQSIIEQYSSLFANSLNSTVNLFT
jgi:Ca2+-binding EF-hand superfamily protein